MASVSTAYSSMKAIFQRPF